jgi:predicted  nucleic acid-binding Zn-ribbon protein
MSTCKDIEKRKSEQREDALKKDLENVKREKERMCDKYAELAIALKEVTDELR